MAFTAANENTYGFSEVTEEDEQILVTNGLGRTALDAELVLIGKYFGNVSKYGGIANGSTGYINICGDRTIRTKQIEATTTFTVGGVVYFVPGGSSAAGKLYGVATALGVPVGICLEEEGTGGAQTSVTFRPFAQNSKDALDGSIRQIAYKVTTGAAAIVVPGLHAGDEIVDVMIVPTGASTNGTIKLTNGTNDITNAMLCATDKTIARATTVDDAYSTLPAAGATIVCAGDTIGNTKAIVLISYIPA
jgi:hypothetical protein